MWFGNRKVESLSLKVETMLYLLHHCSHMHFRHLELKIKQVKPQLVSICSPLQKLKDC